MIGLSYAGEVFSYHRARGDKWGVLSGACFGVAYQIVPVRGRENVWRWTFYPRIGHGASHSGEHVGSGAAAEEACRAAIRAFMGEAFTAKKRPVF